MGRKEDLKKDFDFSGWVTKNNVVCSDKRVIRNGAFAHCNGKVVPLVWNHQHNAPENVVGKMLLEDRPGQGTYGYGKFNDNETGLESKELVHSGCITALSIYANHVRESDGNVVHGDISEVSLVLAGANPEAYIETFFEHGVDGEEGMVFWNSSDDDSCEIMVHSDEDDEPGDPEESVPEEGDDIEHADGKEEPKEDEKGKTLMDAVNDLPENAQEILEAFAKLADGGKTSEETIAELSKDFEALPKEQRDVIAAAIGAMEEAKDNAGEDSGEEDNGGNEMKHSAFENDLENGGVQENVLSHSDIKEIIDTAKRNNTSLSQTYSDYCIAHSIDTTGMELPSAATASQNYGVRDLNMLFPEAKAASPRPEFIGRDTSWVGVLMSSVHRTPYKNVKSVFADITEDAARAKGYIKGQQKATEVFTVLKRKTHPTTIYKYQRVDRDDIVDIEDFDTVAWIKEEMNIMLDEEKARAILIGDGRLGNDDYKIDENCIRPIATDVPLFNIKKNVSVAANATDAEVYTQFIDDVVRARKDYKGSGNPICFTTEDVLTECLLLKDKDGYRMYKSEAELATALRVSRIVTVEVMENVQIDSKPLMAIIVNPKDYNVGGDTNKEQGLFDGFDIKFNQFEYLRETRMSGALIKPFSAITVLLDRAKAGNNAG